MKNENVTFTFELGEREHQKLHEIAENEHRTLAGQLRFIIDEWLELHMLKEKMAAKKADK